MQIKDLHTKIVLILAGVYFVSQFLRSALGISILDISQDFNLNYEQIGRLGGIFFLSFALMQIPLGILLDRFNPLKIIFYMVIIIYIGTIILSFSNSFEIAFFARTLQGIGCSVCLMGPLVYLAKTSSRKRFSTLSGVIMGLGGLGSLFAFSPFYKLNLLLGWKGSFFAFSFLILAVLIIMIYLLKNTKVESVLNDNENDLKSFIRIFTNRNFLYILPMSVFGYASFAFLLTLWGSNYLKLNQSISDNDIANILMFTALFWTLGSLFFGAVNQKISSNKSLVIMSAFSMATLLLLLTFFKVNGYYYILIIFCLYGFIGAFTLVVLDHYRKLFDSRILGRVLTSANLFNFGGVFFIQWIVGIVIEFSTERIGVSIDKAFSISFVLISFLLLLSILFYLKSDETES